MRSSPSELFDAKVTFVVFRGEVLAFFRATKYPEETVWKKEEPRIDAWGHRLQASYAHVGQHGEASTDILRNARRATPEEYGPLMSEMEDIGYNVTPHQSGRLSLSYDHGKTYRRLAMVVAAARDMTWDDESCGVANYREAHNMCMQKIMSIATGGKEIRE